MRTLQHQYLPAIFVSPFSADSLLGMIDAANFARTIHLAILPCRVEVSFYIAHADRKFLKQATKLPIAYEFDIVEFSMGFGGAIKTLVGHADTLEGDARMALTVGGLAADDFLIGVPSKRTPILTAAFTLDQCSNSVADRHDVDAVILARRAIYRSESLFLP